MKKFVIKMLVMCSILGTLLFAVNAAYIHTDYYKKLNDMGKFSNMPEHIDVMNFGASHSQSAFDWSDYDDFEGFNMALGAQTLEYDEALFNYYIAHLDKGSTVILEVMFKSLYECVQTEGPYGTDITRYYQILPREYMRQWNLEDAVKFDYIPILGNRQAALSNIADEWFIKDDEQNNLQKPFSELNGDPTQLLEGWEEVDMIEEGERRANNFMNASGNQEHGMQYAALIRMIEKCEEKDIQVVLVTAPTLPCFYKKIEEDFLEQFYADMEEICQKYDLIYSDYTGDERLLEDYRWYADTDHLNRYGSKVFTQIFLEDHRDILRFYN